MILVQLSEESFNCEFLGATPAYCNLTNITVDGSSGMCVEPKEAQFMSGVYGKSCSSNLDCLAFELQQDSRGE